MSLPPAEIRRMADAISALYTRADQLSNQFGRDHFPDFAEHNRRVSPIFGCIQDAEWALAESNGILVQECLRLGQELADEAEAFLQGRTR